MAVNFLRLGKKIVAIGRNYAEHAKELGNEVPRGSPVFFLKPWSSIVQMPLPIVRPERCKDLHHEVELGVVIGRRARKVRENEAMDYVGGYVLAIDMTARDLQDAAKKKGLPWAEAKGADTFCPLSSFIPKALVPDPHQVQLWLKVDEQLRQNGNTKDMVFRIPELLAFLSTFMTFDEGDLLLTGTPAGVGPVLPGQTITAGIDGLPLSHVRFAVVEQA